MADDKPYDTSQVSKTKRRRLRANILRNCMWESIQRSKANRVDCSEDSKLTDIHSRLSFMESMLMEMHWVAIGQWRFFYDTADATEAGNQSSSAATQQVPPCYPESSTESFLNQATHASFFDRCSGARDRLAEHCRSAYDDVSNHCAKANKAVNLPLHPALAEHPGVQSAPAASATASKGFHGITCSTDDVEAPDDRQPTSQPSQIRMKQDSVKQGVVNDVIKFMQKNSVESFELYPTEGILCATARGGGQVAFEVDKDDITHLIPIARERHISITSHFQAKYDPTASTFPVVSSQQSAEIHSEHEQDSNDSPNFSYAQLPDIVDFTCQEFAAKYNMPLDHFKAIADAVKEGLPACGDSQGGRPTGAQIKKLIDSVNQVCVEHLVQQRKDRAG